MQIDKKTIRKVFWVAVGSIFFYWLLHETERASKLWNAFAGICAPFVIGAVLAFILNVPMRAFERHLKFIRNEGLRRALGIVLTLAAIVLLFYGVIRLLVPEISETITMLIPKLTEFFQQMEQRFFAFLENNPELLAWVSANTNLQNLNWASLIQQAATMLKNSLTVIAGGAFSAVGSVAGTLVDILIGFVFSLYCLARKEILARQGRRILYAFLPERFSDEFIRIMRLTNVTFSNFISGQCLEAVILGCMFAVAMAIFRMPYIPLISVLIAVTALVPIVGAFVGCVFGAFFIFVDNPVMAFWFVVMFLIIQQIENNVVYPKVVGKSVGLPGMWVLLAVTVGGNLMGVGGMLMMVPLASVAYTLLREQTTKRLKTREIDSDKLRDHPPEFRKRFKPKQKKEKTDKAEQQKVQQENS